MTARRTIAIEAIACDDAGRARACAIQGPDELSPSSLIRHEPDETLVATLRGADVARVSLWWRAAPPVHGERTAAIGHYATRSDAAGVALLRAACERLRAHGATLVFAPMDGNTWRRYRAVTWCASDPPFLLEPFTPPAWPSHFRAAGFGTHAQYRSTCSDALAAEPVDDALDDRFAADGFHCRTLDAARIDDELSTLWRLACDAFAANVLYTPLGEAEFRSMYAPLAQGVARELVLIAEREGEPVGFVFSYPDGMQAARGEAVDTIVVKTMGVARAYMRRGVGAWLYRRTVRAARALGFHRAIHALMHDDNPSRRLGSSRKRLIRRYALYARAL